MPFALKLPRRNPDAPRPSLRERAAALKVSAAKVIGKGRSPHRWPRLAGGGAPSKALSDLIEAHMLAYARCLHGMGEEGADVPALRAAEEEAFRALLHTPLTSDADRGCYAAAVIERENGFLVRGYAGTRNDPLSVAYRNLRFGEHAPEPAQEAEPEPVEAAAPVLMNIDDPRSGLMTYADARGDLHTKPFAEGLAFMAARLNAVARTEYHRRFNAEANELDAAGCEELDARLRRELRLDALHILAFRFEQAFAEGQAERQGSTGAGASAAKVDLKPLTVLQLVNLHEAYAAARFLWEGVVARPYSVAWRDPRGCVHATPVGHLADFEETRAALIGDRIINELTSRSPPE
ncbi:hypothetical protein VQ02_10215 [Methylobacterium variabile]|uniref:Uncharacterized protein n=1 Tax=Methylobacterium variabile TaxID=298794 RepID=A0A0J6VJK1_9HYPH|nr:hypothetical protein [Methylobacterium variabile]KMO39306.1 hypothetical protein VQ02_10215 [Methylobacterium variabile]